MEQEPVSLIDQLGGTGAVAARLRQKDNTVSMWRERGIPWKWRPSIVEFANEKGVPIPPDFLLPDQASAA